MGRAYFPPCLFLFSTTTQATITVNIRRPKKPDCENINLPAPYPANVIYNLATSAAWLRRLAATIRRDMFNVSVKPARVILLA
jgi:hypothetical protein